jgi:hypothetical protein
MNREALWALIRRTADTLEFGEEPVLDLPSTVEELDELRAFLAPIGQAVRLINALSLEGMQPSLGSRGFAKFGDRVYRAAPESKWKLREEKASEFWEWVNSEDAARRLFNPNSARITGLRDLGDHWHNRETGEVGFDAFEDYFMDVETDAVKVTEMPASRAPGFIQKAGEGTVEKRDAK